MGSINISTTLTSTRWISHRAGDRDAQSDSGAGESEEAGLAYDESSVGHGADGAAMNALQTLQSQRRVGYFDLHPDRRPAQTQSIVEDPRAKLAASNSDSDEDEDDTPVPVRPLPRPPVVPRGARQAAARSRTGRAEASRP